MPTITLSRVQKAQFIIPLILAIPIAAVLLPIAIIQQSLRGNHRAITMLVCIALLTAAVAVNSIGCAPPAYAHEEEQPPSPTITAAYDEKDSGSVIVVWDELSAPYYRIGWTTWADFVDDKAAGRSLYDTLLYQDAQAQSHPLHVLKRLPVCEEVIIVVGNINRRFAPASWSQAIIHLPGERNGDCD